MKKQLFAVCAPGLEKITEGELRQFSLLAPGRPKLRGDFSADELAGGITFEGDLEEIYCANLNLRTASRILLRLDSFYVSGFPELIRKVKKIAWEKYLGPHTSIAIRVTCRKSRLYHSQAVAERITQGISKRLEHSITVGKFEEDSGKKLPQLIIVRIARDRCTISIDTSGAPLHKRGYRLAVAKAPLRETLAAAMILSCGWDGKVPLYDPFCGSGAIAIEAAMISANLPPGGNRKFAFMNWPGYQKDLWQTYLARTDKERVEGNVNLWASDRDAGAIVSADANARRAGSADSINFRCCAVSAIQPPEETGWIITNPPYGVRASANSDLRNLYAQFGKVLRAKFPNWRIALLCHDTSLLKHAGLRISEQSPQVNGGIKVILVKSVVK